MVLGFVVLGFVVLGFVVLGFVVLGFVVLDIAGEDNLNAIMQDIDLYLLSIRPAPDAPV
jgi:hypothetical protein